MHQAWQINVCKSIFKLKILKLNHCLTDVKCCFRNARKCRCILSHFELVCYYQAYFSSHQALDCSLWSDRSFVIAVLHFQYISFVSFKSIVTYFNENQCYPLKIEDKSRFWSNSIFLSLLFTML